MMCLLLPLPVKQLTSAIAQDGQVAARGRCYDYLIYQSPLGGPIQYMNSITAAICTKLQSPAARPTKTPVVLHKMSSAE
ncbi:MAG: hypothetical protein DRR04_05525 [Gammaproteobacteria bacterium]|nr:MAG: hypothetical protein DRR04_05525 [Gammaproteobacteria bacterium]